MPEARRMPILAILLAVLGGCASLEGPEYGVYDPLEGANRFSYRATQRMDKYLVEPLARGYRAVLPRPARQGVANFFANLKTVDSAVSAFLQGKPKAGGIETARLVVNSTLGIGGLVDVATRLGLPAQHEDLGQTLAVWGYERSRYVWLPIVGPTTFRDLPNALLERLFLVPILLGDVYHPALGGLDIISYRADNLAETEARDQAALDPYSFTREAYYQRRRYLIFDGRPPVEDFESLLDELDAQ